MPLTSTRRERRRFSVNGQPPGAIHNGLREVSVGRCRGNTRTDSFPLVNFFYLPRPSFNAGVVVTFELRDPKNNFLAGDTKKVLYAYSKWRPEKFCMKEDAGSVNLDTGRQVKGNGTKCWN